MNGEEWLALGDEFKILSPRFIIERPRVAIFSERCRFLGKDARVFDLRISLTAKAQAKPSPEEKIVEWFKHNPLAKSGTLERLRA
jgi:hypothetical protein